MENKGLTDTNEDNAQRKKNYYVKSSSHFRLIFPLHLPENKKRANTHLNGRTYVDDNEHFIIPNCFFIYTFFFCLRLSVCVFALKFTLFSLFCVVILFAKMNRSFFLHPCSLLHEHDLIRKNSGSSDAVTFFIRLGLLRTILLMCVLEK